MSLFGDVVKRWLGPGKGAFIFFVYEKMNAPFPGLERSRQATLLYLDRLMARMRPVVVGAVVAVVTASSLGGKWDWETVNTLRLPLPLAACMDSFGHSRAHGDGLSVRR